MNSERKIPIAEDTDYAPTAGLTQTKSDLSLPQTCKGNPAGTEKGCI